MFIDLWILTGIGGFCTGVVVTTALLAGIASRQSKTPRTVRPPHNNGT